ncbi:527_t:CDS:2 [Paraglomus occultum]|uniref:527_t:CDS:1 n=1 Tax=Paraglomus occultum TaxID=144539 RepID=A0A9N9CHI8_9GLOM|nr:527_t:CDS:2 [Paraglomus occultum]
MQKEEDGENDSGEVEFESRDLSLRHEEMLDAFMASHAEGLRRVRPVEFPKCDIDEELEDVAFTAYELLEGLRHIWKCKPSFENADHSENAFVIHVLARILVPIFAFDEEDKMPVMRAWAEQVSQSSLERKERMGATTTGNKPDLRVRLFLLDDVDVEEVESEKELTEVDLELVFAEFSPFDAPETKHINDWARTGIIGSPWAFDLFDLTIPLSVSDRKAVETLLKNALTLRRYFRDVISRVRKLKTESMYLPLAPIDLRRQKTKWLEV